MLNALHWRLCRGNRPLPPPSHTHSASCLGGRTFPSESIAVVPKYKRSRSRYITDIFQSRGILRDHTPALMRPTRPLKGVLRFSTLPQQTGFFSAKNREFSKPERVFWEGDGAILFSFASLAKALAHPKKFLAPFSRGRGSDSPECAC